MKWPAVTFLNEINFLTGFGDLLLCDLVDEKSARKLTSLWTVRIILLAISLGIGIHNGFTVACWATLLAALGVYIVSMGFAIEKINDTEPPVSTFFFSCISVTNWLLATPYGIGDKKHTERAFWLCINLLAGLIFAGYVFTDGPLKTGWGCYPPTIPWSEVGAAGVCPQNHYGSWKTCDTPPVRTSAFTACQTFSRVSHLGSDAFRAAMLITVASIASYIVSIGRNRRKAIQA